MVDHTQFEVRVHVFQVVNSIALSIAMAACPAAGVEIVPFNVGWKGER